MLSKNRKIILLLCLLGTLALLIAGAFLVPNLLIPYGNAKNTMDPGGILTIQANDDGTMQASWPAGENAERYTLEILETDGTVLHTATTTACFAALPELPADRELTMRVTSSCGYGSHTRQGEEALEATVTLPAPQIEDLSWIPNADLGTVDISFDMEPGDLCRVYMAADDGEPVLTEELHEGELRLCFGAGEKYALPEYGQTLQFTFQVERTVGNVSYQGSTAAGFTLTREHLLGTDLNVQYTDNGEASYTLTWNETKGARYEVRLSEDGGRSWRTVTTVDADQERTYTLRNLEAYADYSVMVAAVGGQTMPDSEYAAVSETIELRTGANLLYSTIWPMMDVKAYADAEATQELGTVTAGSAWCVLGLEGQYFKIRYNGQDAYINSEYCMINLTEYLGSLCVYDITNSYSSIYTVHEYGISKVSGAVISGYENVQIAKGEYLVPLLFPTAQKLLKAGEAAKEQGYTLKIYDSYRPQIATGQIYQRTSAILENTVPSSTYSGKTVKDLHLLDWDPDEEEEVAATEPVQTDPTDSPAGETTPAAGDAETITPSTESSEEAASTAGEITIAEVTIVPLANETKSKELTYEILMTNNGEYRLGVFLAAGTSRHNFGVALDLTMVDSDGREVSMQTSMHDLSWYSAARRNNTNANILYKIMTGAGFHNIYSEWWHYQDDEIYAKNTYKPLKNGVSWECWVTDGVGWRYRLADGSYYALCTQTIDGESYTFDENGYVTE